MKKAAELGIRVLSEADFRLLLPGMEAPSPESVRDEVEPTLF